MTATRRVKAEPSAVRAGFILVELLAMLTIIVFVLIATTRMLMTQIELQQVERQHQNRVAAMDSLVRRVRGDLLAAAGWRWAAGGSDGAPLAPAPTSSSSAPATQARGVLSLDVFDAGVVHVVEYGLESDQVVRTVRGTDETVQTDAWSSHRLYFDAALESGPRGAILRLSFVEQPPPRRRRLPDRTYTTVLALPTASTETEDRP